MNNDIVIEEKRRQEAREQADRDKLEREERKKEEKEKHKNDVDAKIENFVMNNLFAIEDLEKALWYIARELERRKKENTPKVKGTVHDYR